MQPIVLVDLSNLAFRTHFAFRNLSSGGNPTGMIFGVLKAIADLRQNISKHLVFVWDHGIPMLGAQKPKNWREDFIPTYKANRTRDEEDWPKIVNQFQDVSFLIKLLGYSNIASMGLEADDVIGILSKEIPGDILIFSTDKDFYQLLCNRVQILVPKKDKGLFQKITAADVKKEFGIEVWDFDKYLALGGDGCDNIKPVRGMGPKTAIKLVQAGAEPGKPWSQQSKSFQKEYEEKYKIHWNAVQASYVAARIPRTRTDIRFSQMPLNFSALDLPCSQVFNSENQRLQSLEVFTKFCADRELNSILANRRSYFETNQLSVEDSTPCPNIPTPIPLPKKKAVLPPRKTLI